jgi:ABC-type multidrug transport system ATPase subunit
MALMTRPSILLLDEPATGLAPVIVRDVMASLAGINRESGTTVVIVEQNIPATLKIVSRAIVLKSGRIIFNRPNGELERRRPCGPVLTGPNEYSMMKVRRFCECDLNALAPHDITDVKCLPRPSGSGAPFATAAA